MEFRPSIAPKNDQDPATLFLEQYRGQRRTLPVPALSGPPPAVLQIQDPNLLQYAKDAWRAADQLAVRIDFLQSVLTVLNFRCSITDDTQRAVEEVFPQLTGLQGVLDERAGLAKRFSCDPNALLRALYDLVDQPARALEEIGVRSDVFQRGVGMYWGGLTVDFFFRGTSLAIERRPLTCDILARLGKEAVRLKGLLEITPAAALDLPKGLPAPQTLEAESLGPNAPGPARPRLRVDRKKGTVPTSAPARSLNRPRPRTPCGRPSGRPSEKRVRPSGSATRWPPAHSTD
jgi:hypothetical protein